jgi:hypothetical protein
VGHAIHRYVIQVAHSVLPCTDPEKIINDTIIWYEFTHTEWAAGNALYGAQNAADAGAIVTRFYERPADISGQSQYRAEHAEQIYPSSAGV